MSGVTNSTGQAPAGDQNPEPSPEQKALASRWGKRLERALKEQTADKKEEKLKNLRKYVRGEVGDDGKSGLVRTNIIHANFAAILPQIYAKNPEIAVTPSEAADPSAYPWVAGFCKTLQAVLNRKFIKGAKLKKRAKSAIRSAMTTSEGWAKVSWQKDIRTDPILQNRIADTQDNLQRIQALLKDIEEGNDQRCELEAKQAEVQQQLEALQQQAEVKTVSGIVIDRVLTEDMFILDDTITDFDGYEQADALAHRVWMTCDRYKEVFGKEPPKKAAKYGQDKKENGNRQDENAVLLVAVFEVWDRVSNTVYTLCSGADEWARDPYTPSVNGQRFYPFFALAFNPVDGKPEPLSDTELLIDLQDEYNTTRTNFADHRKENLPVRVYRKSGDLTDNDIKNLTNRKSGEWVGIEGNPATPLQQDIAILQNPPVDPANYDVQPILRDAEMVLGAGDASKGTINKAKTATEAEIMAQGLQSRVAERQDVAEDWISEMAQYAAELCLQEMGKAEVIRIAGESAVWPELTKNQIFDLVQIEIRAGSTGKPNRNREREQWVQLLPEIQKAIVQIADLREKGQQDMAETVTKLLEETLRRFDERIDIEQFIPPRAKDGEKPQIPPELQQQLEQMQQAMQQLQAQNQELQQAAADKQQEISARLEEARITAETRAAAEVESARIKAELERERIASQERIAMARETESAKSEAMLSAMRQMMTFMGAMAQKMGCCMEDMGDDHESMAGRGGAADTLPDNPALTAPTI